MLEQCELVMELAFIYVVVEELVVESLQSQLLELLSAHSILLSRSEIFVCVLLDTGHEVTETLEVVAILREIFIEVALEVNDVGVLGLVVGVLEEMRDGGGAVLELSQEVQLVDLSWLSFAHFV